MVRFSTKELNELLNILPSVEWSDYWTNVRDAT